MKKYILILVFEHKFDVLVSQADQIGSTNGSDHKIDIIVQRLHLMDSPKQPLLTY